MSSVERHVRRRPVYVRAFAAAILLVLGSALAGPSYCGMASPTSAVSEEPDAHDCCKKGLTGARPGCCHVDSVTVAVAVLKTTPVVIQPAGASGLLPSPVEARSVHAPAASGASFASLAAGCASVPEDSGFADVQRAVMIETRQPVEWDPRKDVQPPDDAMVASQLADELTVDRAVQIAFANNRDLQATLEELVLARAELIAASTIRNPLFDGEVRFPGSPRSPFEIVFSQTLVDIFQLGNRKRLGRA